MKTGRFSIEQLSEGFFELFKDGSFIKMDPSRLDDLETDPSLGVYSSAIGIDPVLISDGEFNVVVDPGLGWGLDHSSAYKNTSNIITNLDIFGLRPQDIDFVILTHLHFDHAAGCTFVNADSETSLTFPNAKYLVRQDEWEFAVHQQITKSDITPGAGYKLDEFYKIAAENRFEFITHDEIEVINGIKMIKSAGHTPGHQIVKIESGGDTAYILGDLIPTEYHLNHYAMKLIDYDQIQAKKFKTLLLKQALKENARLYFYHSLFNKTGRLAKDRHRNYVLVDEKRKF